MFFKIEMSDNLAKFWLKLYGDFSAEKEFKGNVVQNKYYFK